MKSLTTNKFRWSADSDGQWLSFRTESAAKALQGIEEGKYYDVEITPHKERRSLDANAYFHVLVGKIAEHQRLGFEETKVNLVTEYGTVARDARGSMVGIKIPSSADPAVFYRYVKAFDTRIEGGIEFTCYIVFKPTHELNTSEMSKLIDGAVYEAKNLGIETLPPEKLAAMKGAWQA